LKHPNDEEINSDWFLKCTAVQDEQDNPSHIINIGVGLPRSHTKVGLTIAGEINKANGVVEREGYQRQKLYERASSECREPDNVGR